LAIIGFWQVSFFIHPLKFDIIDCTYPWKYFAGECLQHHLLPMWNPYQTLGYPIHADPQVGIWYPFTWLFGYFSGYTIYSLETEFLLHIYIASLGMYLLGRTLKFSKNSSFLMAVAYMFSGLFIGNSQHYMIIVGAAWIPFIISYYIRLSESNKIIDALIAAFFMFMLISGGYPAFTMILFYLLAAFLLFYIIPKIRKKEWKSVIILCRQNLFFFVSTLLFSAVVLVSVFSVSAFITRGYKIPLSTALFCPFSPQSLISIILPYASIKDPEFFKTDPSMTNIYFGLVIFLFFIYSLFLKKTGIVRLFLWFGIISLCAAFGAYLPLRKFLWDYFPMMGMFRFPSLFRLFTIIGFIISAGFALEVFQNSEKIKKKYFNILIFAIASSLLAVIIYSRTRGYLSMMEFVHHDIWIATNTSSIWQHIAFQSTVQICFLLLLFLIFRKYSDKKIRINYIILISVCDLLFASWLNEPYTTYDHTSKTNTIAIHASTFPKDFPIPSSRNIILNNDTSLGSGLFWKNMSIFHKQVAWDGFTSFKFEGYDYMTDSVLGVFRSSLSNPLAYLTSKVFPEDSMKIHENHKTFFHKNIYLKKENFSDVSTKDFSGSKGDTAIIASFSPSAIKITVSSKAPQILALQQYFYTGWTVTINEKDSQIMQFNKGLMCVEIPKGVSTVIFKYYNSGIVYMAILSLACLLIFFIFLIVNRKTI
jgi:MFS family permease